ncbi:MAG: hypothetical protein IKR12_03195 [Clostridia bacterium]|nr:hypothetical protein [Clostridia bacterium]
MSFFYVFMVVLILVIVLQFTIKIKLYFNVKNNTGKLQVSFINIKIIDYNISICSRCIRFSKKNKKNKYLPISFDKQTIESYNKFKDILFRKVYAKQLGIYFNFGLKNRADITAMTVGYVDIFSKIAYSVLKTKKSEVEMDLKTYANFNNSVIKFGLKAKISLSIFDLIWSFSEAKVKKILVNRPKEKVNARQ